MLKLECPIEFLRCEAFDFPFNKPESDGIQIWDKTTLILVQISAAGQTGIGYTYGSASMISPKSEITHIVQQWNRLKLSEKNQ